ncbi:acyltransferase [Pseudonocardiaceae bacterium YIM PH 21723]|nr:acyltransferase [Pseudonocardiaceae bacterium YIM PH 21723]
MGFAEYRATRVFGSLNGLRCLSILAVIWHHCGGDIADRPVLRTGHLGVALFFVISGFLITTLLLRERQDNGRISLPRFYARRSLRIFPLYYAVIALHVVLVLFLWRPSAYGEQFLQNLPFFLTYTSNWFVSMGSALYLAWSLAAEEQFYLVWPTIERFLPGSWPVLIASALLIVSVAVSGVVPATLIVYLPAGLLLGVLLAHTLHDERGYRLVRGLVGGPFGSPAVLVLVALDLLTLEDIAHPWGVLLVIGLLTALVAACVVREDHGLAGVLRLRPVDWIGRVSYGMYLLHLLVLDVVTKVLGVTPPPVRFVLVSGLTVVVASASYRWFESVFLRRKERFAVVRTGRPAPRHCL